MNWEHHFLKFLLIFNWEGADIRHQIWPREIPELFIDPFLTISKNVCFDAQKNHLMQTVLLNTHNIWFD